MNQREASKKDWNSENTLNEINAGSLQRIADATEKMAASYDTLRNDRDYYKRRSEEQSTIITKLYRRISALQGVITRMRNKNNDHQNH